MGVSLLGYGCGSKSASTAGGVSGDFTGTAKGMGGDEMCIRDSIVAAAQVCSLGKNGGEVGILAVQQGDLLLCARDLVALLQQEDVYKRQN